MSPYPAKVGWKDLHCKLSSDAHVQLVETTKRLRISKTKVVELLIKHFSERLQRKKD